MPSAGNPSGTGRLKPNRGPAAAIQPSGPDHLARIEDIVGVEGALQPAHHLDLDRRLVVHDLVDLHAADAMFGRDRALHRSEEHTSELQSLMRLSYAVFCLKKKTHKQTIS